MDVTIGGQQEARHLTHGPQARELAPGRLSKYRTSHKAVTMYLGGSKSLGQWEPVHRQEAIAIVTADFAPTVALVLVVPSLLP